MGPFNGVWFEYRTSAVIKISYQISEHNNYRVFSLIDEAKIRLSNSRILIEALFHYFIIFINNKHQILSSHLNSVSYTYRRNLKFSLFKATS